MLKTYPALLQRVIPDAGPGANFRIILQATDSQMARITADAQYPGCKCSGAPVQNLFPQ